MEPTIEYYKYKDEVYYVSEVNPTGFPADEKVMMKTADGWAQAALYYPVTEYVGVKDPKKTTTRINWSTQYIRPLEDFLAKFEPLPNYKD